MSCKDHTIYGCVHEQTNTRYAMAIPTGTIVGVGLIQFAFLFCTVNGIILCEVST